MKDLEAGRELDILIATKIMGIKKIYYPADGQFPYYIPSGKPWRTHRIDARPLPLFSTDISAAMDVWEAVRRSGRWCCLEIFSDYHYLYEIKLTPHIFIRAEKAQNVLTEETHRPTIIEQANTKEELPLAICRAAMKAVEKRSEGP